MDYADKLDVENHLDWFKGLISNKNYIVLDNSVLGIWFFSMDIGGDYEERIIPVRKDVELLRGLGKLFSKEECFVFAKETVEEFSEYSDGILGIRKKITRRATRNKHQYPKSWSGHHVIEERTSLSQRYGRHCKRLARAMRVVAGQMSSLEDLIPKEGERYLRPTQGAVKKLKNRFYEENPDRLQKKRKPGKIENELNDVIIFSKCLALAYDVPVDVVSSDTDFQAMHDSVYSPRSLGIFVKEGVLALPENKVILTRVKSDGEKKSYIPIISITGDSFVSAVE